MIRTGMSRAVLPALAWSALAGRLPGWLDARWFESGDDLLGLAGEAEIGWFDSPRGVAIREAVAAARRLRWLNTVAAGVDPFPLDILRERGVVLTNGAGLNAVPISEYIVMTMLTIAKDFRSVLRAGERHEWLGDAPGKGELFGSRVLILGAGGIGSTLAARLAPFGMDVVTVRRRPGPGDLGPDQWRERLGGFDWVVVLVPSTPDTRHLIGAAELAAMKPGATLLNFARGAVVDQAALVAGLRRGQPAHAVLDVTEPEPLPPDDPLWSLPNATITMHLSGRSQTRLIERAAERFLGNLERWRRGEMLENRVDLALGY